MPIRPSEVDQTVQAALKERFAQIFAQNATLDPVAARVRGAGVQKWRETAKRFAGYLWSAGAVAASSFIALPVVGPTHKGAAVLMFMLLNGLAVGLVARGFARTQQELSRFVNADVMRAAAQLVALSRAEQLYCEAVAALVDAEAALGEAVQRDMLRHLNELLETYRKLEAPLRRHRAASGGAAVEELQRDLASLQQRRAAQENEAARETMDQSIALCSRRLETALALEPAREQAEAQQELILQTLASVQSSLVSIHASPAAPPAAGVEGLQESVLQVSRQARATEEAVAEVLGLRAGQGINGRD
jgi:hypothetical protein